MRMPGAPPVEAEDEFVEVGLEMLAAQPVVYAQGPDLDVGEDPVNPREHDVGGHLADDMRIVGEAGSAGISGPTIGFGGGAGDEVGREKGTEAGGRVIGDLVQPDAAGTKTSVLDLEGADDQHFALMAAPAPAGDRIVLAGHMISVSSTSTRPASGFRSGASMLRRSLAQSSQSELALQLQR
jgi:hypothetical protein